MPKKRFSIVSPFYFNESSVPSTIERLQRLANQLDKYELEFIFIDDGSKDKSLELIKKKQNQDARIRLIKLTRNFGAPQALLAGLQFATGDCIGVVSFDLQDPPEQFIDMLKLWESGKKVVIGERHNRDDPFLTKVFAKLFYVIFRNLAIKDYPKAGFDLVLFDQQVLKEINSFKEKNCHPMILIHWLGFDYEKITYTREKRQHGKSRWTFSKRIKFFIDSFVGFSYSPIRLISIFGICCAIISLFFGLLTLFNKLLGNIPVPGWAGIVIILTFFMSLNMVMLGVIGEYIWRILDESRGRKPYIIDDVYEANKINEENQ